LFQPIEESESEFFLLFFFIKKVSMKRENIELHERCTFLEHELHTLRMLKEDESARYCLQFFVVFFVCIDLKEVEESQVVSTF